MQLTFQFPREFFITGTDTNVGKTFVSAILMLGLQSAYWKPIQSGGDPTDTEWLETSTKMNKSHFIGEQYKLTKPLSPHLAAQIDGKSIRLEDLQAPTFHAYDHLIVEGAGGLMVPINDKHNMIDLIKHLNLPALLVARSTLGTINHTLLSIEQLRRSEVPILGVVMNGPLNQHNCEAIERYGRVKVLAQIPG